MKLMKLSAATLALSLSAASQAFVASWDWETSTGLVPDAGWDGTTNTSTEQVETKNLPGSANLSDLVTNSVSGTGVGQTLGWGIESNAQDEQSILAIQNLDSDGADPAGTNAAANSGVALESDGDAQLINTFTHHNNVITDSNSPWSAYLQGGFSITGAVGGNPAGFSQKNIGSKSQVRLKETTNESDVADCNAPNPYGSKCDDFFTFSGLSAPELFYTDGDGLGYFVIFDFVVLTPPEDLANGAIVPTETGVLIYTAEKAETVIGTTARVFTRQVPVPGVLALLGLGLVAAGIARRKR